MVDPTDELLRVERGRFLCYRLFDIGDECDLRRAEELLGVEREGPRRLRLTRAGSESLDLTSPPLDVGLGLKRIGLRSDGVADAAVSARLLDYGNLSVRFELEIPSGTALEELIPLAQELYESSALTTEARAVRDMLVSRLAGSLFRPHDWPDVETYTVVYVEALEGHPRGERVLEDPSLPRLLQGESGPRPLAPGTRRDVQRSAFSYLDDDLVVIDWDSAFVLEPSGSRDVPDLLELACAQVTGLRYYDDLLDAELDRIYSEASLARRRWWTLVWSPYQELAREVLARWMELTEFTERIDNAIKVVGDFYLARVYQGALERLRVRAWQASVDRKQDLVARVYELLKHEVEAQRNFLLELAIVLLIVFEIVLAAFKVM